MEFDFCCIAWKRRTGWTPWLGSVLGGTTKWEPRTLVIQGEMLQYYENGKEDGPPRGELNIVADKVQMQIVAHKPPPVAEPAPASVNHNQSSNNNNNYSNATNHDQEASSSSSAAPAEESKEQAPTTGGDSSSVTPPSDEGETSTTDPAAQQQQQQQPLYPDEAPTPHEVDIVAHPAGSQKATVWKFCFDQQSDLMVCLENIHRVLENSGVYKPLEADRFEHDFQPADHIYRWEMIMVPPVIYPIQIHGIVLEAGRNCVVVADFGLTGYSKQQGKEFNHVDDQHNNALKAAFAKLRPNVDQRLHISTLIDPKEIRKWTKAGYDEDSIFYHTKKSKAMEAMSSFFGKVSSSMRRTDADNPKNDPNGESHTGPVVRITDANEPESPPGKTHHATRPAKEELPQSDPAEIVLERAHFLLENMQVLPPYHVFYSNSECIAVWCKTGRWSTLQTAVFLSTNSVGAAKSSTLATIGAVAANPLLAPVVALGGLVWVTAPMYILKKSREQWHTITVYMTDVFWSAAPARVVVACLRHWSGLVVDDYRDKPRIIRRPTTNNGVASPTQQRVSTSTPPLSSPVRPTAPPPLAAPPPLPLDDEQ